MATFREAKKENLLRVFLDLSRTAEEVSYLPVGGGQPRTLRALVRPARGMLRDREDASATLEELDVRVSNDPAASIDGNPVGGVQVPRIGDGLLRSGETRPFSLAFVVEANSVSWLLRFERETLDQVGRGQTRD